MLNGSGGGVKIPLFSDVSFATERGGKHDKHTRLYEATWYKDEVSACLESRGC